MKRLFIAVDLSDNQDVNKVYSEVKKKLFNNNIRWTKPENMHLTIKFLGSTPVEKVEKITSIMQNTIEESRSIALRFSRVGLFGSRYKPRVIWLGFKENSPLNELAENLKRKLEPIGFPYDRQNFVPHLTLGRINKILSKPHFQSVLDQYQELVFEPLKIGSIYLYESVLRKEGPEYRVIKEIKMVSE